MKGEEHWLQLPAVSCFTHPQHGLLPFDTENTQAARRTEPCPGLYYILGDARRAELLAISVCCTVSLLLPACLLFMLCHAYLPAACLYDLSVEYAQQQVCFIKVMLVYINIKQYQWQQAELELAFSSSENSSSSSSRSSSAAAPYRS